MIYLILIIATILRIINLNQSLWLDEAISAVSVKNYSLSDLIFKFMPGDVHPPLHYVLLWFWTKFFGFSEISLRLPSLIFAVLSIYLLYLLLKKVFDQKIGLLASLILAFNPLLIYYSQEARMYSLNLCVVVLSFFAFIKFINKEKYGLPLYVLSLALIFYSDYVLYPILLVQIIYLLLNAKDKVKEFLLGVAVALVFFIPWLPIFVVQFAKGKEVAANLGNWTAIVGGASIKNIVLFIVKSLIGKISLDNKYLYGLLSLLAIVSSGVPILFALPKLKNRKILLFILWLLVPTAILFFLSIYIEVFSYHRLSFVIPALATLVALGLAKMKKPVTIFFIAMILLIDLVSLSIYFNIPKFQREDWRSVVTFAESRNLPILLENNNLFAPIEYYSSDKSKYIAGLNNIPAKNLDDITNQIDDKTDILLFEYLVDITDPQKLLPKKLELLGFQKKQIYNFNGVGFVTLYSKL